MTGRIFIISETGAGRTYHSGLSHKTSSMLLQPTDYSAEPFYPALYFSPLKI